MSHSYFQLLSIYLLGRLLLDENESLLHFLLSFSWRIRFPPSIYYFRWLSRYTGDKDYCSFAKYGARYPEDIEIAWFGWQFVDQQLDRFVHAAPYLDLFVGWVSTHFKLIIPKEKALFNKIKQISFDFSLAYWMKYCNHKDSSAILLSSKPLTIFSRSWIAAWGFRPFGQVTVHIPMFWHSYNLMSFAKYSSLSFVNWSLESTIHLYACMRTAGPK